MITAASKPRHPKSMPAAAAEIRASAGTLAPKIAKSGKLLGASAGRILKGGALKSKANLFPETAGGACSVDRCRSLD